MAKDCLFYEIPEKCKACDFAEKCLFLKMITDLLKVMKDLKGGPFKLFGLGGLGKNLEKKD